MPNDDSRRTSTWLDQRLRRRVRLPGNDWSDDGSSTRVLIEADDHALSWAMQATLERAGYEVETCPGPSSTRRCALLDSGRCELQAGADVIVNCLAGDARNGHPLARRTIEATPACPLILDVTDPERAGAPEGTAVLIRPWNGPELVDAVRAATGRPPTIG